jgi:hypothetical protein
MYFMYSFEILRCWLNFWLNDKGVMVPTWHWFHVPKIARAIDNQVFIRQIFCSTLEQSVFTEFKNVAIDSFNFPTC